MEDDIEVPAARATILLEMTVPLTRADFIGDGDLLVFPSADRLFRIGEVLEDGSYGGDLCRADNPNCLLDWVWYTPEEMVLMGMRIFRPLHTVH